ncbi:hypothetical protein C1H46_007361 [Malus baccata]|uniref:TF-B3 domain-containing protein n=1 Tax=Malus baccata TaxID=106549 RepID=A0A540N7D9_MALBA|nr:hypothetical protein C1H46_007361 [Malus baccata]
MEVVSPCPEEEASTELTFWTTNKKRKPEAKCPNPKLEKLALDDHNTNKKGDLRENTTAMFSRLSPRDAGEIKKTLQVNDLRNLLILETNFVKNLTYLTTSRTVHDCNTFSKHRMILKLLESPAKSYAFDEDWNQEFVKMRELKEGDEIGLGLYTTTPSKFMFTFSVLKGACLVHDQE